MVISLLLSMKLVCMPPILRGNIPQAIIDRATVVCRKEYSGCVVSITEMGVQSYKVNCKRMIYTNRIAEN